MTVESPEEIAARIVSGYTNTLSSLGAFGAADWTVMFRQDIATAIREAQARVWEECATKYEAQEQAADQRADATYEPLNMAVSRRHRMVAATYSGVATHARAQAAKIRESKP